jgi:hypothetical protein
VAKFKRKNGTPDGRVICISSPGAKTGKFFEEYERSFTDDNEVFMLQAPTWEIDPGISSRYLRDKYRENPIGFKSEFGAQFTDRLFGWIEDPEIVRKNVIPGLKYKDRSMLRVPHFMGIDVGLKNDGTAVAIGHWVSELVNGARSEKIELDYSAVRYSEDEEKEYFVPDELAEWFAELASKFYVYKGLMDQYYGMTIVPVLQKKGLKQFEFRQFNDALNSAVYQVLLSDFISGNMRLPEGDVRIVGDNKDNDSVLVKEILTLQAEQKSKYMIKVFAPDRKGEHDDLSDSLARMVFIANEYKSKGLGVTGSMTIGSSGSSVRASMRMRRSEYMKASLNRPSPRMMGRMNNRIRMPMMMSGRF